EEEAPPEPEPVIDEAEVPRRPDAIREREERREEREDAEREESAPALAEDLAAGAEVLRDLLALMGIEAEVALDDGPRHEGIEVLGPDLGALIGRGGENLVALQQITSAITSRRVGRTVHVPLDIEGYRRRREEQLREIARRVAARVRTSGQAVTLEPMLAYERRIVHLAVQDTPGVKTESVGVDPNRRVVISSTAPGARGPAQFRPGPPRGLRGGGYRSVLITFMPIVVRRLGGSTIDVAIVIAAPFVGHLLSPISAYLLMGFPQVRVVAGTVTLARATFLAGVLVAATPLMLAMTTVVTFIISVANISAYTALMQGIYPGRERASAMANVRIGGAIAGIAAAAVAGTFIDVIPAAWVFAAAALIGLPGAAAFF